MKHVHDNQSKGSKYEDSEQRTPIVAEFFSLVHPGRPGVVRSFADGGRAASAQRPLIIEHTGELARYLDGVKIAEPVVFDRLAVYPVLVSGSSLLPGRWLTLDAALSSGALTITDRRTRTKPVSWVENSSFDENVFLMKDEIVRRGTQTRIVRRDTVLAPGERMELNVLCAQPPPSASDKPLSASRAILPPLLPETSQSPYQVERRFDGPRKMAHGAEYRSGSLEPVPKSKPIDGRLEHLCREIVPRIPRGTTGFIFVCDGQSLGADFFGSEDLALKLLPKLLKSYALDHASVPNTANDLGNERNDTEATEFFERICGARSEATSTTGAGIGLRTNDRGLLGGGVAADGLVVHYGIRVEELGTPYNRPRPSIIWPRSEMHRQRQ